MENMEQTIARLGFDPHESIECVNISAHPQKFGLADHRNVSKYYDVPVGGRCMIQRGLTVERRQAKQNKKALCSILEMFTSGNIVPVDSDKGRAFLKKAKAA